MAGTKGSGRPGGNPDLKTAEFQQKYGFKQQYDKDEPLSVQLQLRITKSMSEALKQQENKAEFVRQAIGAALAQANAEKLTQQ